MFLLCFTVFAIATDEYVMCCLLLKLNYYQFDTVTEKIYNHLSINSSMTLLMFNYLFDYAYFDLIDNVMLIAELVINCVMCHSIS
jgi:hypothetical protein